MASEVAERDAEASGEAANADDAPDNDAVEPFSDDTDELTDDNAVDPLGDEAAFERCPSASSTSPALSADDAALGADDVADPAFGADDAALGATVTNGVPGGDEGEVARGNAAAVLVVGGRELGTLGKARSEIFVAGGGEPEVRSSSVPRVTGGIGFTSGAKSGEAA